MVATGMTGLIASRKGIVNVTLDSEGFAAHGMDNGMAVPAQLRILEFKALDEL
jgi:hypothetical protein